MKQQDTLRLAMHLSAQAQTKAPASAQTPAPAQLAEALGVSLSTLDTWLLSETSQDYRHMPENAQRLLAHLYGVRKSTNLSMPYDWSNPAMTDEGLILSVLRRAHFPDLVRLCADWGVGRVKAQVAAALDLAPESERPILARILARMLYSIEIALEEFKRTHLTT